MILGPQFGGHTPTLPLALSHLEREVPEYAVEQVRWLEVWGVDEVIHTLRVGAYPGTLVGGVVKDQVGE